MKVELTAQETLHIDMPVVISGLSGAFLWVSIFAFWTSSCHLLQKRRLLVKTIGHPQSLHIASEVLQFPHWRKRHKSFTSRVGWTWCLLWALLWRAANKLHERYVVGTLWTTWLALKYIFHSVFLSLHGALWMVGSLLRCFTGKIDLLPGRQQVGDISNTFRAVLRGYPPGLRSWTIPIPKQRSGERCCVGSQLVCVSRRELNSTYAARPDPPSVFACCATGPTVTTLPLLEGDQRTLICHAATSNMDIQAFFTKEKWGRIGNMPYYFWTPTSAHAYMYSNK